MQALVDTSSSLTITDRPMPTVGPEEVLVEIAAAGVNRADLLQRDGHYPPPAGASDLLGLEVSGVVAERGADVTGWPIGSRVCALLSGGGYATHCVVPKGHLLPLPDHWSYEEGAAYPEAAVTAYLNLFRIGMVEKGEKVMVHSGGSGVGLAAINLLQVVSCCIVATVGSNSKRDRLLELGVDHVVNYQKENFRSSIEEKYGPSALDLILDTVGGPYLRDNVALLATNGRLILIGALGGAKGKLVLPVVMQKRLKIIGSVLRSLSVEEKSDLISEFQTRFPIAKLSPPTIHQVYPWAEADEAHRVLRESKNFGKVVLKMRTEHSPED